MFVAAAEAVLLSPATVVPLRTVRLPHRACATNAFNQDVSKWNVARVTNMREMFMYATAFNHDVSGWSVERVTDMYWTFYGASKFNQDLSKWDTGSVTRMDGMFFQASSFPPQDLSRWNTSKVISASTAGTSGRGMFRGAFKFNSDLSFWDVSRVTDFGHMFYDARDFNGDGGPGAADRIRRRGGQGGPARRRRGRAAPRGPGRHGLTGVRAGHHEAGDLPRLFPVHVHLLPAAHGWSEQEQGGK